MFSDRGGHEGRMETKLTVSREANRRVLLPHAHGHFTPIRSCDDTLENFVPFKFSSSFVHMNK